MAWRVRAQTPKEWAISAGLAHIRTAPARAVKQARSVALAVQGQRVTATARQLGLCAVTVRRCLKRLHAEGVVGLANRPRSAPAGRTAGSCSRIGSGGRWTPTRSPTATSRGSPARAGLPRIRFHDLRHTYATLALLNGERPKVVQEALGHSTVTLTLDTYSHLLPELQEEAAQRMDRLLGLGG